VLSDKTAQKQTGEAESADVENSIARLSNKVSSYAVGSSAIDEPS
jgi:hypothetical protein